MIELTPAQAHAALEQAYQEQRCPSCAREVDSFGSFLSGTTGGVWFWCDSCIDPEVLAMVLPLKGDRERGNGCAG